MATRTKPTSARLYDEDFYAWSEQQADLLRAGRFSELDLRHLIEEVEDLGGALYRSVRSRVRTIVEHLLKLEYSPATEPREGWCETVEAQRRDLDDDLTASLRPRIEGELQRHYARARAAAARSLRRHGEHAAAAALPETCPYSLDQIAGDRWP